MRRWVLPLALGVVLALVGYHVTTVQFPRILMRLAVHRLSKPGINTMYFAPLATDKARAIVRPSPDLAYASCPFDLSNGPIVVDAPSVPAPYWSLSVFDARTDVAYIRNNVTGGDRPIRIAIARDGQPVPDSMAAVRVKGARGIALLRVLVQDRAAFAPIDAARRRASCRSLS